jgi:hypothetical protein
MFKRRVTNTSDLHKGLTEAYKRRRCRGFCPGFWTTRCEMGVEDDFPERAEPAVPANPPLGHGARTAIVRMVVMQRSSSLKTKEFNSNARIRLLCS